MNAIRITVYDTARQDQTALHIAELQDGSITTFETRIYYWLIYPDGRSEPEVTQRDIRAAQAHRTVVSILQTIVRTPTRTGGVTPTVLTALRPYLNEGRMVKGVSTLRPAEMHEAARELELLSWPVSAQRNFRRTLALLSTPDTAA